MDQQIRNSILLMLKINPRAKFTYLKIDFTSLIIASKIFYKIFCHPSQSFFSKKRDVPAASSSSRSLQSRERTVHTRLDTLSNSSACGGVAGQLPLRLHESKAAKWNGKMAVGIVTAQLLFLDGRGGGFRLLSHDATADGNRAKRREVKSGPLSCGRGSRKVTHSPSPTWKQQRRQVS